MKDDRKECASNPGALEWFVHALRVVEPHGDYFDVLSQTTAASAPTSEAA